jgi:hypothetical protein
LHLVEIDLKNTIDPIKKDNIHPTTDKAQLGGVAKAKLWRGMVTLSGIVQSPNVLTRYSREKVPCQRPRKSGAESGHRTGLLYRG